MSTIPTNTPTMQVSLLPTPSRFEEPANIELFRLALPRMTGYQSDLAHDVVTLHAAEVGDVFIWVVRENGTHIFRGDIDDTDPTWSDNNRKHVEFFRKNFERCWTYRIEIVAKYGERGFPYIRVSEVL